MRAHADIYQAALDARTDQLAGGTLRVYTGALGAFGATPAGTLLASFVMPDPGHNAAAFNAGAGQYEATKSGSWQDLAADSGGAIGCFTIAVGGVIKLDGTAGGPGSGADMICSQASVVQGASFSVNTFTLRETPVS